LAKSGRVIAERRAAPRPAPDTAVVTVGEETVVCAASTGRPVSLNPVAATLWACLDGTATVDEIAADVAAVTGRDLLGVIRDLRHLVRRWERLGLVTDGWPPATAPRRRQPATLRRVAVPPDE
jgi:hypothetical protein